MTFQQKPGTGALFRNDKKGNDKAPDYRGNGVSIAGEALDLAGWLKKDKNGKTFLSLSIKAPRDRAAPDKLQSARKPLRDDLDDEIKF